MRSGANTLTRMETFEEMDSRIKAEMLAEHIEHAPIAFQPAYPGQPDPGKRGIGTLRCGDCNQIIDETWSHSCKQQRQRNRVTERMNSRKK